MRHYFVILTLLFIATIHSVAIADEDKLLTQFIQAQKIENPTITIHPPSIDAKGYVLLDATTGKVLAEKNANERMSPASLTKLMTLFVISEALQSGRLSLNDNVVVSTHAWHMGGSRMFLKAGQKVAVEDLIRGIVIVSGNDACIAMAEHIAGSEESFVDLMNQQAKLLGMNDTHFTDCTGMPDKNHYSTPKDLAILARSLVEFFPQFYHNWYSTKWFTFNGIRQPNRNRLLWRDDSVDGIKTGHTDTAGFCLIASALRNNMRLISVVMGTPSDSARTEQSQRLLNFGFRFYESYTLYKADAILTEPRIWMGKYKTIPAGIKDALSVTIPAGEYKRLKAKVDMPEVITAPIQKGETLGTIQIMLKDTVIAEGKMIALESDPVGGVWSRFKDFLILKWHAIWHKETITQNLQSKA